MLRTGERFGRREFKGGCNWIIEEGVDTDWLLLCVEKCQSMLGESDWRRFKVDNIRAWFFIIKRNRSNFLIIDQDVNVTIAWPN